MKFKIHGAGDQELLEAENREDAMEKLLAWNGLSISEVPEKEYYVTGAFVEGRTIDGKRVLVVTRIEDDTFYDGQECNDEIEQEFGL